MDSTCETWIRQCVIFQDRFRFFRFWLSFSILSFFKILFRSDTMFIVMIILFWNPLKPVKINTVRLLALTIALSLAVRVDTWLCESVYQNSIECTFSYPQGRNPSDCFIKIHIFTLFILNLLGRAQSVIPTNLYC